ncbi:MAG: hypothetical protein MJZ89_03435 [Paludibacteraceae bacterium]|nr:hypothetical protein [Paludibacteraceae bacterium]
MITNFRIKFFCRSFDLRLYERSRLFYESLGYPCVRLTDQTADGYFYTMLEDEECDIAINVDEDCFLTNTDALFQLVNYVVENGIANAGCPDGGGSTRRNANALITNPFFNIFNLKLIREKAGNSQAIRAAVKAFDYVLHLKELEDKYPKEILQKEGRFTLLNIEPYYPFFFWMAWHFKTMYLRSQFHADGWTTILFNQENQIICEHTWLARFYSVPSFIVKHWQADAGKQQDRINARIAEVASMRGDIVIPEERPIDTLRYACDKSIRWCIKVPQRIAGWPKKIKLKLTNKRTAERKISRMR